LCCGWWGPLATWNPEALSWSVAVGDLAGERERLLGEVERLRA